MTEVKLSETTIGGAYLTPSGEIALSTPLAMKEYIYNESRGEAGKEYLLTAAIQDDTAISVQCAALAESDSLALAIINGIPSYFTQGKGEVGGIQCLYKSVSGVQKYKEGLILFNLNLIKLANQS